MLSGIYRAAGGMRAEIEVQDTIAHNIANAATAAYKRRVPAFSNVMLGVRGAAAAGRTAAVPPAPVSIQNGSLVAEVTYQAAHYGRDSSPGQTRFTGSDLDVALSGGGFFTLKTPSDDAVYTRCGAFHEGPDGNLVSSQGYVVQGINGPIDVSGGKITIARDGEVMVDGQSRGQLQITDIGDLGASEELAGGVFRSGNITSVGDFEVQQGYIESSNVNTVEEMVAMITSLRAYEAAQKAVTSSDRILEKAVNEVGRVA